MEKYSKVAEITDSYLHGKLNKFTIEYKTKEDLNIFISYEDMHSYNFDYNLVIHPESKACDFICHKSLGMLYKFQLNRDIKFEQALCGFLFNTSN